MPGLRDPAPQGSAGLLAMDAATRASLELHRARDGGTLHTLFGTVQRTLSPAGARMLAGWLGAPLTDTAAIAARQDAWGWLLADRAGRRGTACRAACHARHRPRAGSAVGQPRRATRSGGAARWAAGGSEGCGGSGRQPAGDAAIAAQQTGGALTGGALTGRALTGGDVDVALPPALHAARVALHVDPSLEQRLADALADPAPHRLDDGNAIRAGFDAELDAERALRDDSRRVIATLQLDYAQRFGVASLKIRHHAQLGYVIEAPAAAVEKLRDFPELTLRQGMANGARFTTPELSDLDRRIAEAGERAAARERAVFAQLVQEALAHADALAACADALAFLDAVQSAAKLAEVRHLVPPAGDRRRRIPGEIRSPPGGGSRARGPRGLCAE